MKESLSKKVKLEDTLSLKKILSLHQFSKSCTGMIYILGDYKLVNLNNLPKLVSFLLTCKHHEIKIVVEGPDARRTLTELHSLIKSTKTNVTTKVLNASI